MNFEDLTPEQQKAAESIDTAQEALSFIESEGIELTDEELEQVSGGWSKLKRKKGRTKATCPKCGAHLTLKPDEKVCPFCGVSLEEAL